MRTLLARWLLDPVTSWHAWRAFVSSRGNVTFDAAWRRCRVARFPDEMPYLQHGHTPPTPPAQDPHQPS
ncbi:hypothetical protein [Streptomyces hydrogenans]|uniref:hypothetical protein n=1 Tax=Streptomyces hydrogenans TaxID=1873719 RepID=UPI00369FDF31